MIFKNNEEAISAIKSNLKINEEFVEMRECSDELKALVNGDDFIEELIENIEGIESNVKAEARRKYSRSILVVTGQSGSSIAYFWKSRLLVILTKITYSNVLNSAKKQDGCRIAVDQPEHALRRGGVERKF